MDNVIGTIREFNTAQFRVVVDALEESDLDLSWDDTGEITEKLSSYEYVAFCARVRVLHAQLGEVGASYLGQCIYSDISDFEDHRECAKRTRALRAENSAAVCGSYFADMVAEAIQDARNTLLSMPKQIPYIRK